MHNILRRILGLVFLLFFGNCGQVANYTPPAACDHLTQEGSAAVLYCKTSGTTPTQTFTCTSPKLGDSESKCTIACKEPDIMISDAKKSNLGVQGFKGSTDTVVYCFLTNR